MEIENHEITVNVGEDGAWICMKTSAGKSFCFQPIQVFKPTDHFRKYIEEWCADMQNQYVKQQDQVCPRCGEEVGELDPDGCRDSDCPLLYPQEDMMVSKFGYIREYYGVPAKCGARVKYVDKWGTVTGTNGPHLKVRLDGEKYSLIYHPTDLIWPDMVDELKE